ncbi:MAG: ABC transporter permease [Hyphomicrobiales bacterium]|nr:ABC transporter permease [Hyphomicrobiales bacterium]MBV9429929.1 ABC transporter permease [Bradyrhizobiaceae bacterium]
MTAAPAANGPEWRLLLPLGAFFVLFFAAPLVVLLLVSFSDGLALNAFSLAHYAKFLGDSFSLSILIDTLLLGVKATAVCLLFGLPLAWVCVHASPRLRSLLLFLVILPILTSVVVRTFAWIVILGQQGILNKAFLSLGLIDSPLRLLFSEVGVVMVLAQVQMPLMVLPLITTLQRIDPNLAEASRALGAGHWRTFRRVILPLWLPGLVAGCILVFAACTTAFVTQTLIGGARLVYMPLYIYQQAAGANNWPFAAAMSVLLMISVLLVVYLLNLLGRTRAVPRHG